MSTLKCIIDDYLDTLSLRGRSEHTIGAYRQTLLKLTAFVGDVGVRDINHRVITRFLAAQRDAGAAPATVHKRYADLHSFFHWCEREDEITGSPMTRVEKPHREEEPVDLVDPATIKALLSLEWRSPFFTARNRAMITVSLDTGVRVAELCAMQVEDFDSTHHRLTVRGVKGSGTRVVPLGRAATIALRRYLRTRSRSRHADRPALWLGTRGDMTTSAVRMILRRACEDAGVEHVYPHQMRHTFAHHFRLAGGSDGDLMYLGGWSSTAMLQRYGASGAAVRAAEAHAKFSPGDRLL